MTTFDAKTAARFIAEAHAGRADYQNLSGALAPGSIADAYAAQEALVEHWAPLWGPVAGLKIATTTKVMQALMGIDHPCGGMIYEQRIHRAPAALSMADYIHPMIECELAVRVNRALPSKATPYTAGEVREAVGELMAAFELIEDRNAIYKETDARTLIADNAWNAGIVVGEAKTVSTSMPLDGITGRLSRNGNAAGEGKTDGPMDALAWVANLAADRGRPLQAGMIVITGSVIATFEARAGERLAFELDGIGRTELAFSA